MHGWNGKILRVNLNEKTSAVQSYDRDFALNYLGGRGFAIKILWDELPAGTDPLSPRNKLIFTTGPLTGLPVASSGKIVVAAKSPLTNGYGDGNLGSRAAVTLRKAGYEVLVVEGKADSPVYILIEDDSVEIKDAKDLWGRGTFDVEDDLTRTHGKSAGVLLIGQAGENLVKFAPVMSQKGRAGGRPGMGAVMGSKNLKAVVIRGTKDIPLADPESLKELGRDAYKDIREKESYDFWIRQGTMQALEWANESSCLPSYNFKEGVFDEAKGIDGYKVEELKVDRRGCPNCNMQCGNVIKDIEGQEAELDYENVGLLGSNIGIGKLKEVALLNRLADDWGIDTISAGNIIGFVMEASEKNLLSETYRWGSVDDARSLLEAIAFRKGFGKTLAEGVKHTAATIGKGSEKWAIQCKGLECSAYDCHAAPGMALAFATSSIGAHHKDAWLISWEIATDRSGYNREKVAKLIELQQLRGGVFEGLVACRLPWIEVGFALDWYPKFLKAATGENLSLDQLKTAGDRIFALIRCFWKRENPDFGRSWDMPPERWFTEPLTKGPMKGTKVDREGYTRMQNWYYEIRGWDSNGIPTRKTLESLGLAYAAEALHIA
ncbi:MAG: aldehyde ferredoxin oxidoreductase family protein [Theionarchaea archaeon]|nr:aldehyde ferredoxin oxidoreductase family protein [Theionarchaea archaeon]MBU7038006.1 aldehyde ferredoxin oxidoreductase family protein [Theionarchaea archaeon]